jgi:hypothetical protein
MTRLSPVSALRSPLFTVCPTAIALLTDLGILATFSGPPKRSRNPLRNKRISRFSLASRRTTALSTSSDE